MDNQVTKDYEAEYENDLALAFRWLDNLTLGAGNAYEAMRGIYPGWVNGTLQICPTNMDEMRRIVKAIKDSLPPTAEPMRKIRQYDIFPALTVQVGVFKVVIEYPSGVCERKQVGTETVKERVLVNEHVLEYEEVEKEVPIYETNCPSILDE